MNPLRENTQLSNSSYKKFKLLVDKQKTALRIDKFLIKYLKNLTRNKIQNLIKRGNVFVNNHMVKYNYQINYLDLIEIQYNYLILSKLISKNIPLDILYEDQDLMVINKNYGIVVHPGNGNYSGTLINALKFYFEKKKIPLPLNMGLVHRLDKDTSGLILIAKTNNSFKHLSKQFFYRMIKKIYLVLVWGDLKKPSFCLTGYIGRNLYKRECMDVFSSSNKGKYAITYYKILERFNYVTFLSCYLESGRTHQIRAHFKYINNPLFNDYISGGNKILKGKIHSKYKQFIKNCFLSLPRQALHASHISFLHPINKKKLFFHSKLPSDMSILLDKWRNYLGEL